MHDTPPLVPMTLVIRVTRSGSDLYLHHRDGTVTIHPASLAVLGESTPPTVFLIQDREEGYLELPLTPQTQDQIIVCMHGDGTYTWADWSLGDLQLLTAHVRGGQVVAFTAGEGNTARAVPFEAYPDGQATVLGLIRQALEQAEYAPEFGGTPLIFRPVPLWNGTCEGCGVPVVRGPLCTACDELIQAHDARRTELEGELAPVLLAWWRRLAAQSIPEVDRLAAMAGTFEELQQKHGLTQD